jgi:mRNA interferase MazF
MKQEKPAQVIRGQMYFADLNPVVGSEQGGIRPVVVVQNNVGNTHSPTIIVAPITTQVKKTWLPTHIGIPSVFGLPQQSMAMLEQIRTIDRERFGEYVGCLDDDAMGQIDKALGISVGLNEVTTNDRPIRRESHDQPKEAPEEMVLTLCGPCLQQFISSPEHIVKRVTPMQEKEPCMYCNVRSGYDYRIIRRKKRLGDDRY